MVAKWKPRVLLGDSPKAVSANGHYAARSIRACEWKQTPTHDARRTTHATTPRRGHRTSKAHHCNLALTVLPACDAVMSCAALLVHAILSCACCQFPSLRTGHAPSPRLPEFKLTDCASCVDAITLTTGTPWQTRLQMNLSRSVEAASSFPMSSR